MAPRGSQLDYEVEPEPAVQFRSMAPRGSQQVTFAQIVDHRFYLDPWLHEGANKLDPNVPGHLGNLDPWLHEGANALIGVVICVTFFI